MRMVHGLDNAVEVLCRDRGLHLDRVPPHVLKKSAEAFGESLTPMQVVERILREVRESGDRALRDLNLKLDGRVLDRIEVPRTVVSGAYDAVSAEVVEALETAAGRVRRFHEATLPKGWLDFAEGYGELVVPLERVGAYVPGGTAPLPSTVLMSVIPAKVAGVKEVMVASPPGETGSPHPAVLVAAGIAGADRVFQIGGAQAIAAMAYGTETVPAVDMICGPGNVFVTLAKKLLYGEVGIDGLYGPTETVVIADETANPTLCAADLLAQAEHDVMATPVLITTSQRVADAVQRELAARVERLDRADIARSALDEQGAIAIVEEMDQALELANRFAPEHMCLMVSEPWRHVGKVKNAGAVFLGEFSHEVLGDYVAGPSHIMPTGGTARFGSGLSVRSFLKFSPVVALDDAASSALAKVASTIARAEGLTGHAEAAEIREELLDAE
jgi:histidinol dehydrogenase